MKNHITAEFVAFGRKYHLATGPDAFLQEDSLWRLKAIYEPYLAAHPLPKTGVAVDIGAGFGVFAVPFAAAYPDWTIWCFEPDTAAFAALCENVDTLGLTNLFTVNAAVGVAGASTSKNTDKALHQAIKARDADAIRAASKEQFYFRHTTKPGYIEAAFTAKSKPDFKRIALPSFPADALSLLKPDLAKVMAPQSEKAIFDSLAQTAVSHIVGESWSTFPSTELFKPRKSGLQAYIPIAGSPLKLHRRENQLGQEHGLDVVVAMYNTKDYVLECIEGILASDTPDIRALVIDDGSTDGCAELVKEAYKDNPRVLVHRKPNGGCASARNYGRLMSNRSHITFVDADDVADAQLFPELLELARYSGAEVVQGGFDLLLDKGGQPVFEETSESEDFASYPRHAFGARSFFILPGAALIVGQPTIWRRVYRRDYLDNKNIWFPEHIRAFDDQIFQILSLQYAGNVHCMDHVKMHYRQHPGQDIKQGDERGFYSLEMFRMVMKRAISEGWNDFQPVLRSYVNTVNWVHDGLGPDLKPVFIKGAAELWVYMHKTLGTDGFSAFKDTDFTARDFARHVADFNAKLKDIGPSYAWSYLDAMTMHPGMVRGSRARLTSEAT